MSEDTATWLKADGNLIIASGGRMLLRSDALGRYDDLGIRQKVSVEWGGENLDAVVRRIHANGDIVVELARS